MGNMWRNEVLYFANAVDLSLDGNLIPVVNFSAPPSVRSVYLNKNRINSILTGTLHPTIERLDLNSNGLTSLYFLLSFPRLNILNLAENRISRIRRQDLQAPVRLKTLNLSGNRVHSIDEKSFSDLTDVFLIDLSNNSLMTLGPSTFPYSSLRILHLHSNEILSVRDIFSRGPSRLESLSLSDNSFTQPLNNLLNITRTVRFLNMSKLSENEDTALESLGNIEFERLTYLHLSTDNLAAFMFSLNAPSLTRLNLKSNRLQSIPNDFLKMTRDIEDLFLQYNHIKYVGKWDLQGLKKLFHLNLAKNHINLIETGAFRFAQKLWLLDLTGNNIHQLAYEAYFSLLFQDNGLRLGGNPFRCTCELSWLQNELVSTNAETEMRCLTPSHMFNKSIVEEELLCPPVLCEGIPYDPIINVLPGDLVHLTCPVLLNVGAWIEWMLDLSSTNLSSSSVDTKSFPSSDADIVLTYENTRLVYNVPDEDSNIQCSASNWAGTTTFDIHLVVCDFANTDECRRDGSRTVTEFNDLVDKRCKPPSVLFTTSIPDEPRTESNKTGMLYYDCGLMTFLSLICHLMISHQSYTVQVFIL